MMVELSMRRLSQMSVGQEEGNHVNVESVDIKEFKALALFVVIMEGFIGHYIVIVSHLFRFLWEVCA